MARQQAMYVERVRPVLKEKLLHLPKQQTARAYTVVDCMTRLVDLY